MKKLSITLLSLCLLFGLSACHRSPEDKAQHAVDYMTWRYDLNEQQVQTVTKFSAEVTAMRDELKASKQQRIDELYSLLEQENLQSQQLGEWFEAQNDFLQSTVKGHSNQLLGLFTEFHNSLDKEQRAELNETITKHKNRHH